MIAAAFAAVIVAIGALIAHWLGGKWLSDETLKTLSEIIPTTIAFVGGIAVGFKSTGNRRNREGG